MIRDPASGATGQIKPLYPFPAFIAKTCSRSSSGSYKAAALFTYSGKYYIQYVAKHINPEIPL